MSRSDVSSNSGGMIDNRQSRWTQNLPPLAAFFAFLKAIVPVLLSAVRELPTVLRNAYDISQETLDRDPTGSLRMGIKIVMASTVLVLGGLFTVVSAGQAFGTDGWVTTVPAVARAESAVRDVLPDSLGGGSDAGTKVALDIPSEYLALYQEAADRCDMQWEVLAGVGSIETNHGRLDAPGVHSGANFAGASGPMQFMAPTWAAYGVDGNGDGKKNVFEPADAIHGAANYLCANGGGTDSSLDNALWHYNRDRTYVAEVKQRAADYKDRSYAAPLDAGVVDSAALTRPHHSYPAVDIMLPVGTPVHAVHGGRATTLNDSRCGLGVQIDGNDGATYVYCHAQSLNVRSGTKVSAGQQIMTSGGTPNARGAGSSTTPHLHLQIEVSGHKVCPQQLMVAWSEGRFESPDQAKKSGCVS